MPSEDILTHTRSGNSSYTVTWVPSYYHPTRYMYLFILLNPKHRKISSSTTLITVQYTTSPLSPAFLY